MIVNFKKASAIGTCLAVLLTLFVGCSVFTDKNSSAAATTKDNSASSVSSTASASSTSSSNEKLSPSSFSPINKIAKAKLYENIGGSSDDRTVSGSYDLNNDGKSENIKIEFKDSENGGKTSISVGSKSVASSEFIMLAGVYAVDLDSSDKYTELAVVNNGLDADVYTYFYRYDGTLKLLGYCYGGFSDSPSYGYGLTSYNIGVLADGHGMLIPRLGVMRYVSPEIILSAYKLQDNKIGQVKLDLSGVLNKSYTVVSDVKPFFEQVYPMPKGYELKYDDSDIVSIKKGSTIIFKSINTSIGDSLYSTVQLQNNEKGILYFFVHP